jgi:hypothetical protein
MQGSQENGSRMSTFVRGFKSYKQTTLTTKVLFIFNHNVEIERILTKDQP